MQHWLRPLLLVSGPLHFIKEVQSLPCLGVVLGWGRDNDMTASHSCLSFPFSLGWGGGSRLELAPEDNPFTSSWGTNMAEGQRGGGEGQYLHFLRCGLLLGSHPLPAL